MYQQPPVEVDKFLTLKRELFVQAFRAVLPVESTSTNKSSADQDGEKVNSTQKEGASDAQAT